MIESVYLKTVHSFHVMLNTCGYSNHYKTDNVQGTIV